MKTLNKIIMIVGLFLGAFIISCFVVFCLTGVEPTALISGVLGAGGVELILCAIIEISKNKTRAGDITGFDDAEVVDLEETEKENVKG